MPPWERYARTTADLTPAPTATTDAQGPWQRYAPTPPDAPAATPETAYTGMLLPISRDTGGDLHPAVPRAISGIAGAVEDFFSPPANPMGMGGHPTDEAIKWGADTALLALPTSPATGTGKLISAVAGEGTPAKTMGAVRRAVAPMTERGRERLAAATLEKAATDPAGLQKSLAAGGADLVPGSRPTTFQQTGDMGLGSLERGVAAKNPADFMARRAEQNTARVSALEDIQPAGSPEAVSQALRQHLMDLDKATESNVASALGMARGHAQGLGGGGTSEGYGEALRGRLAASEDAAREQERALWQAVDPEGTLTLGTSGVKQAAKDVREGLPPTAKPVEGEEHGIIEAVEELPDVAPFKDVSALRSRLSTAMREELFAHGRTPVYARLSQLRGAVEKDLDGAVSGKVAQEADAIASGALRQEDTVAARIESWRNDWTAKQSQAETRAVDSTGSGTNGAARSASVSGLRGAAGESRSGLGSAPRNQGLPGDVSTFDLAARGRLRAASAATRQRAETFNSGTTGKLLRKSGQSGPYNVPDALVPERIFAPGAKGAESVAAFRKAAGDTEALPILRDYAASNLRAIAERADGTLDPRKVEVWRRRYADALRSFPALDRQVADAATASETLATAGVARREALNEYQLGLVGKIINAEDREEVVKRIGGLFGKPDSTALMRRLVSELGGNPQAREGLRKAIVEHIAGRFIGNTEAATSGLGSMKSDAFQSFIRQNRGPLGQAFSRDEMTTLDAIAEDLRRANRSIAAVKLPGGSNTVQDSITISKGGHSLLYRILTHATAAATGFGLGDLTGGIAAVLGTRAVIAARHAGLEKVDDLVKEAMLDPEVARALLSKSFRLKAERGPVAALTARLWDLAARPPLLPLYRHAGGNNSGTFGDPYEFSGSDAEQQAQFKRIPVGAFYVNPSDGKTYRKVK